MGCEPNLVAQAMWIVPAVCVCASSVLLLGAVILRVFFREE